MTLRTEADTTTATLKLALMQATANANRTQNEKPIDEVQAHFDDLWAKYGTPETAEWKIAFGTMVGWAMNWAVRDTERLASEGRDVPDIDAWRQRVYDVMHSSDTLYDRDAWQALRQDPSLVPSAKELKAAGNDPQALDALKARVWAASQMTNGLTMGELLNFDQDTKDLGPGIYKTQFDDGVGRKLQKRIEASMEVAGPFVGAGDSAWEAMRAVKAGWKAQTIAQRAEQTAKTGAQPYGADSTSKPQSRTGGSTPSSVAVRLKS